MTHDPVDLQYFMLPSPLDALHIYHWCRDRSAPRQDVECFAVGDGPRLPYTSLHEGSIVA